MKLFKEWLMWGLVVALLVCLCIVGFGCQFGYGAGQAVEGAGKDMQWVAEKFLQEQ